MVNQQYKVLQQHPAPDPGTIRIRLWPLQPDPKDRPAPTKRTRRDRWRELRRNADFHDRVLARGRGPRLTLFDLD